MSIQFLPMPAIAYPQNAMINFQPMNQALQFYANNQLERGRFGLQQNQDQRAQEMHPLTMDQTRAQTARFVGQESRDTEMHPLMMTHQQAQTGLTRAQTGQAGAQTALTNVNIANARDEREQRISSLFSLATTPEQHAALVSSLRSRGVQIRPELLDFNTSRGVAPVLSGQQHEYRDQLAHRYGLRPGMPGYTGYVLGGQAPTAAPLDSTSRTQILESDQAIQSGNSAIQSLTQALQLSSQAYSGPTAGIRGTVTGTLGGQAGQATMQFQQTMQAQALEQLKAIFGAAPTEGERRILMEIQGSANQPQPVRDAIIRRAIQAAEARVRFHTERANSLRGGGYFAPGYNPNGAPQSTQGVTVQQPGQGGGVQTTTADQINATPVGQVVTINGRRYRRAADGGFNPE